MSIFSNKLSELMKSYNLSDEQLAELVDVNRTTVTRWRTGERSPKMEKLPEIAQVFKVDPRIFVGEETNDLDVLPVYNLLNNENKNLVYAFASKLLYDQNNVSEDNIVSFDEYKERQQNIAYLGAVSAGTGEYLMDNQPETITLPAEMVPEQADFCLSVNGDSMEPFFYHGEYVFVEEQQELWNGAIGVVIVDGEAFLKKIYFDDDCVRLVSLNPKYEDKIISVCDNFKIIGKVVL